MKCKAAWCNREQKVDHLCKSHWMQQYRGLPLTPLGQWKWSPMQEKTLREMYGDGRLMTSIVSELGLTWNAVMQKVRRMGLSRPTPRNRLARVESRVKRCATCHLMLPCGSTHSILEFATRRGDGGEARMPLRSKMA